MDFSDYQASSSALEKLKNVDFIAIVGPTAVGKTTLMKTAAGIAPMFKMVLNNTSRTQRPGEQDGVDYHFHTREEMLARIARREYVQVAPSLLGEIYATAPEDYPEDGIGMLAVLADAINAFRELPFRTFRVIFIVPPNWLEWQARLKVHGFAPEQLAKRLDEARRSFSYALSAPEVLFVINDNIRAAISDFMAFAEGHPLNERQEADQARARMIIESIMTKL